MDIGNLMIIIILVVIIAIPFIILNRNNKKKKQQLIQQLENLTTKTEQLGEIETLGQMAIALSKTNQTLFFYKKDEEKTQQKTILLAEITFSKVMKSTRTLEGNTQVIDIIEMEFKPKDKKQSPEKIEVFNADLDGQLSGELQFAEKWIQLINQQLKK